MIVIVGESASGKTTLRDMFVEAHPKYKKIVTYTTRPKRNGEIDGIDYHFITQEKFDEYVDKGFFLENARYRNWSYGTAINDCDDKNSIAILTPTGLRKLKKTIDGVVSVYLHVDRRTRLISILERGDDIEEAYRRNLSDVGQFDGIENEVDFIIDNTGFNKNENRVLKCLEKIVYYSISERDDNYENY